MVKYCKCGCGRNIIVKFHHKYQGIPNYINGHATKNKSLGIEHKKKISISKTLPRKQVHCLQCQKNISVKIHEKRKYCSMDCRKEHWKIYHPQKGITWIMRYGFEEAKKKSDKKSIDRRSKTWEEIFGEEKAKQMKENNGNKGVKKSNVENYKKMWKNKEYVEMMLKIRKSEEFRKKTSKSAKLRYRKNPKSHPNYIMGQKGFVSKPQKFLFNQIKKLYSDSSFKVMLEYPVKTEKNVRYVDVAIPALMVGFEYDEPYWHEEVKDKMRKEELENVGWTIFNIVPNNGGKNNGSL